jgi:hypothetical protein
MPFGVGILLNAQSTPSQHLMIMMAGEVGFSVMFV